jgi:hypothetical protein
MRTALGGSNSLIIREIQGISSALAPFEPSQAGKGLCLTDQFEQIPYSTEQGIIWS